MPISNNASGLRPGVCTSTTRPANPYLGQLIFETDTFVMNFWNGSSWQDIESDRVLKSGDTMTGSLFVNTGKFRANRANATSGALAGGMDLMIDGNTWGQIFMTDLNEMRLTSTRTRLEQVIITNQLTYNGDNTGQAGFVAFNGESVKPPTTYINNGGAFNVSNGRFTMPTGLYGFVLCSFNSLIQRPSNVAHAYVEFQVNNVRKSVRTHTMYDIGGNYTSLNNTAIVYCNSGDFVTCNLWTPSAAAYADQYGLGLTFRYLG